MTENEAISGLEILKYQCKYNGECGTCNICYSAVPLAIQAIEEIQQYRAIGTIEEFKALKERTVAKKVKRKHMSDSFEERQLCGEYTLYGHCPNCGEHITNLWNSVNCGDCGQAIDWKD